MSFARSVSIALAVLLAVSAAAPAIAQTSQHEDEKWQDTRLITDKFAARLFGVSTTFSTDVAAGNVLGALVSLEKDLAFDEDLSTGGVGGFYRFGSKRKHALGFNAVILDRDASGVAALFVPVFERSFLGGYESEFKNKYVGLTYRHSLVNTGRAEAGVIAGLGVYEFEFNITGAFVDPDVDCTDPTDPDTCTIPPENTASGSVDVTAPVPTFGLFVNFAILPNLIFEGAAAGIDLEFGDSSGRVLQTSGSLSWYFIRNLGVGIGLEGTDINYKQDKTGDRLNVDYRQNGITVFLTGVF